MVRKKMGYVKLKMCQEYEPQENSARRVQAAVIRRTYAWSREWDEQKCGWEAPLNQAPSVTSVMTPLGPQVSAPNQTNNTAALWGTVGCSWASPKYPQYGPSTW